MFKFNTVIAIGTIGGIILAFLLVGTLGKSLNLPVGDFLTFVGTALGIGSVVVLLYVAIRRTSQSG